MKDLTPIEKVQQDWDNKKGKSNSVLATTPKRGAIQFTRLETEGNKVSIWVTENNSQEADFIIVNPPTDYRDSQGKIVEDPITAIAIAIEGVSK